MSSGDSLFNVLIECLLVLISFCCFIFVGSIIFIGIDAISVILTKKFELCISLIIIILLYGLNFKYFITQKEIKIDTRTVKLINLILIISGALILFFVQNWQVNFLYELTNVTTPLLALSITVYIAWRAWVIMKVRDEIINILKAYGTKSSLDLEEFKKSHPGYEYQSIYIYGEKWFLKKDNRKFKTEFELKAYVILTSYKRGSIFNPFR